MADSKKEIQDKNNPIATAYLNRLLEMVNSIDYGSITLLIQDHQVIQIEKHEKMRLK